MAGGSGARPHPWFRRPDRAGSQPRSDRECLLETRITLRVERGLSLGLVYDFVAENCSFLQGAQNIGSIRLGANYPIDLDRILCGWSTDAAIQSYHQILRGRALTLKYFGRNAVRGVHSNIHTAEVFCTDSGICDSVIRLRGNDGGSHVFNGWCVDFEDTWPRTTYLACHAHADTPGTFVSVRDSTFGRARAETPLAILWGASGPQYRPAFFAAENVSWDGRVLQTNGVLATPPWSVAVRP